MKLISFQMDENYHVKKSELSQCFIVISALPYPADLILQYLILLLCVLRYHTTIIVTEFMEDTHRMYLRWVLQNYGGLFLDRFLKFIAFVFYCWITYYHKYSGLKDTSPLFHSLCESGVQTQLILVVIHRKKMVLLPKLGLCSLAPNRNTETEFWVN